MRLKPFIALAAVTVVVVAGTLFAVTQREAATRGTTERQLLFPDLTDRINEIDRVTVETSADGTITMGREDDRWGMVERFDYPVDFEKVRNTLIELAALTAIEPRTSNPELYEELQVENVEAELSNSIRITAAAGEEKVADLIVGKTRPVDSGGGVYVRKAGEERSWLAEGSFQPERKLVQWLERDIVNVDRRRTRRVEINRPDGKGVVITKDEPTDEAYSLETPVPEGRKVKADTELDALASITDFLILEDVRPIGEVDFSGPHTVDRFVTFDGLEIVMDVVDQDGETWVRVNAAKADRAEGLDAFVEKQKGKDSREGRIADEMKTPEQIEQEIASINDRVEDWAFQVTDYKTGKLKTTLEDVTEEVEAAAPQASQSETGTGETDQGSAGTATSSPTGTPTMPASAGR